ncbi:alpha-amylase family glycosyl hydrolase [Treponema sp. HNW]|uniref:alpha-amylase family glycosyl hydrolase n=1 Tax=Treponema sp. HNW TaxID=3116654 RepID=UPI003D14C10B
MEFLVLKNVRSVCGFSKPLFSSEKTAAGQNIKNLRLFAKNINDNRALLLNNNLSSPAEFFVKAGELNAMGLLNRIFHIVCKEFRKQKNPQAFVSALQKSGESIGAKEVSALLGEFNAEFPTADVYNGKERAETYLSKTRGGMPNAALILEDTILLHLALENPAYKPYLFLFDDKALKKNPQYIPLWNQVQAFFKTQPSFGPNNTDLISMLREPALANPDSLRGQLDYIGRHWSAVIGSAMAELLSAMDIIAEESKPSWAGGAGQNFNPPPMQAYSYENLVKEYERFSPDTDWMPRVVLMAKTVLVWLDQLSKKYGRDIRRLDEIPDEELDTLANRGFTGLWLIGVWRRSEASRRIKQINGNPEAAASAYSLDDYDIAENLGGWEALGNLRARLWVRGIRLAADMVPNHTGMDSKWVIEKPHLFIQRRDNPFPSYSFTGENLSPDNRVQVFVENGYFSKTDCAVVFKRVDSYTGDVRYIYHGNDGTGLPWNDTAQIDFLNPEAREEVIQKILHVARNFPIIRFDAAMVLAKKHIRRLWYPEPGQGGDIASRSESSISIGDFEKAIPNEFWRDVVDRVAQEVPDTLLLAEAFWMMEGYFVRTLGMHRVYNSAFMNMLKKEENYKYRSTIKNTMEFDPQVLKRFVNFMNNPDEETAAVQFGKGDKYFGVCTLMVTMPGLPMFGHGQIEGFSEKYGMEFTKAYWNEGDDYGLIERHNREIFPLVKKRYLFSEVEHFRLYDVWNEGNVNENVFAYTNRAGNQASAVFYNNVYERAAGYIKTSCAYAVKTEAGNVLHTEDFASAWGLTNHGDYYCIFTEQKSGLQFIRSSRELFEKGMYIQLNGFECQVLLDVREVQDDESGTYRLLCEHLGGRGSSDIEAALRDLYLKDLYIPLQELASKDFFAAIAGLCIPHLQPKDAPKPPALSELLTQSEKAGLAYIKALHAFIDGNYGASYVVKPIQAAHKLPIQKVWKRFCSRIQSLVKIASVKTASSIKSGTIEDFCRDFASYPFIPQVTAAYCMLLCIKDSLENLNLHDAYKIVDLWKLEDKILRILNEYGYPVSQTRERLIRMRELHLLYEQLTSVSDTPKKTKTKGSAEKLSARAKTTQSTKTAKPKLKEVTLPDFVKALAAHKNAPLILGTNLFENILWFNRERALETSWTACMLYTLEKGADTGETNALSALNAALKVKQKVDTAVEKSGYKAENALALLKDRAGAKK